METRHILDEDGNIAVSVTLPANSTEEQWKNALSIYIIDPEQEEE